MEPTEDIKTPVAKKRLVHLGLLKKRKEFSGLQILLFAIIFAAIGGGTVWLGLAASDNGKAKRVTIEGTLERVILDNFKAKTDREDFFLKTSGGQRYKLSFPGKGPGKVLGGSKVRVTGDQTGNTIQMASSGGSDLTTVSPASITPLTGTRKVAVVLFNFIDDTSQPFTTDSAMREVFSTDSSAADSVNNFYIRNSYGALKLTGSVNLAGDVFGWITINYSKAGACSYYDWSDAANAALTEKGVDMTAYDNIIYSFPRANCPFGGIAQLPGSRSWNNGGLGSATHELGHNFGMAHANAFECTDSNGFTADSGSCTSREYGDAFDIMGSLGGDLNAFHREQMGWFSGSDIQSVTATGDYVLKDINTPGPAVKAIKMPYATFHGTPFDYLYIEYRPVASNTQVGFGGVLLHEGGLSSNPNLFDNTPETGYVVHHIDAPLPIGRTFKDATWGMTITPYIATSTQVKLHITFGKTSATADNAACVADIAPDGVLPNGVNFTGSVTIKNTGSTTWTPNDYRLGSLSNPDGIWGVDHQDLNTTVPPGGVITLSGVYTSPGVSSFGLPEGFSWRMQKISDSTYFGQACIKPVAVNYDPNRPKPPTNLNVSSVTSSSATFSWTPSVQDNSNGYVWGYQILIKSGKGATKVADIINPSPYQATINGLKPNTSYSLSMVAIGSNVLLSEPSQAVTLKTTR